MAQQKIGIDVEIKASVLTDTEEDATDLSRVVTYFKWRAFINGGYSIYIRIIDPNLSVFQQLVNEKYLKEARKKPLKIKFQINQRVGGEEERQSTRETVAYITNMESGVSGTTGQSGGFFELIAIDPLTWFMNRGAANGKSYAGKVSDVIKKVINEFAPNISVDISTTNDNAANIWHMMRQDPKTFITTLFDWSASITNQETNWIVAPLDETVVIREQGELKSYDLGQYAVNTEYSGAENVIQWHRLDNNYLTNIQTVVSTGGISAVSGLYCDPKNSVTAKQTIVYDETTPNKINVELINNSESPQGFLKPRDQDIGWTFVRAIPEDSAGSVGIKYQDYIDGRARSLYLGSLDTLNRLVIKVTGSVILDDPTKLGASTVYLTWSNANGNPWSANAKWLVYGFEHEYTESHEWFTYIYLNRKDTDSIAKIV